jgi:hypothetical protein
MPNFCLERGVHFIDLSKALDSINSRPEASDYKSLSIAAKVLQILKNKGSMRIRDFPSEAKKLKWNLSENDVKKAVEFLKNLDF